MTYKFKCQYCELLFPGKIFRDTHEKTHAERERLNGWSVGIRDARKKIKALQVTIKVYSERRKKGEPWPG